MVKLSLLSLYVLFTGLYASSRFTHGYDLSKPISAIAKSPRGKIGFIGAMSVFSIIQLIYALALLNELGITNWLPKLSFTLSALILIISSIIVSYKKLHAKLVVISVALICIALILLFSEFYSYNSILTLALAITTILLIASCLYLKHVMKTKYWEMPLLATLIAWNILPLFF